MRPDGDFAAYVAARWPVLVRMLVLLGGRPEEAEDAVRSGLAHDYLDWARISGGDDPGVHVCRSVLEAWRRRSGGWWNTPPADDRAPELVALEDQLDRLTGDERLALVLRFATGLDEQQVAAVVDMPPAAVPGLVARALVRADLAAVRKASR